MKKARVIGGGFSGLMAAYFLTEKGYQVDIYEKSSRWGGLIRTEERSLGSLEWAANGFLSNALLEEVAAKIGVKLIPAGKEHRARYLFYKKLSRWPLNILESLLLLIFGLWSYCTDQLPPRRMESLSTWGQRNFGKAFTEKVLRIAVLGIYAQPIEDLSASLTIKRFFQKELRPAKGKLKGTVAPEKGMEEWITKLKFFLESKGARFFLNSEYESVAPDIAEPHSMSQIPTIISTHVRDLADLTPRQWTGELVQVEHPGILTCTLFLKPTKEDLRGFGVLFHPASGFSALGCLFESDNFPHRHRHRCERYIFSEKYLGGLMLLSDDAILNQTLEDRRKLLGLDSKNVTDLKSDLQTDLKADLLDFQIVRIPQGYPAYSLELELALERTPLHWNHIHLHGNFTGGLGLSQIALRSQQLAQYIDQEGT